MVVFILQHLPGSTASAHPHFYIILLHSSSMIGLIFSGKQLEDGRLHIAASSRINSVSPSTFLHYLVTLIQHDRSHFLWEAVRRWSSSYCSIFPDQQRQPIHISTLSCYTHPA